MCHNLDRPGAFFLDDRLPGRNDGTSYLLADPLEVILAHTRDEVPAALARLDECLAAGRWVAGYIAYEAGLELDAPIKSRHPAPQPLVWLGVYSQCRTVSARHVNLGPPGEPAAIGNPRLNVGEAEYLAAVRRAKDYIAAGDVYQINYTCRLRFDYRGPPLGLLARLRHAHPVCHSAWLNTGTEQVISLSPELFLRCEDSLVTTRPMKGTARRGRWFEEDAQQARRLAEDAKNRAENVMIVDLMRNDLGRLCRPGSIRVVRALDVERYRSLFQMTSTVQGRLRPGTTASALLRATFPPGSVTGAPKLRAMAIIDELERESRGVYCGTMGLFRPGGDCLLSVAIRTIVCRDGVCTLGVGGGIVADSDPQAEWREMQLKSKFLAAEPASFQLLETMFAGDRRPPSYRRKHFERMRRSALYFGWDFPAARLQAALKRVAARGSGNRRLRLLLAENGTCRVESAQAHGQRPAGTPVRLRLSTRRVDPDDIFLYHKTTQRSAYDADYRDAAAQGFFDLLYRNLSGEIAEGAITNLMAQIDGRWVTPPLRCGLLPGIWRAQKLAANYATERPFSLDDLLRAARIVVGNSVRGDFEVEEIVDGGDGRTLWHRPANLPEMPAAAGEKQSLTFSRRGVDLP